MDELPVEIIEHLLSYNDLTIKDIINFSSTCCHLREIIINNNAFWRSIYMQKWPEFRNIDHGCIQNWLLEIKHIYDVAAKAYEILAEMSPRYYKRYELSDSDLVDWKDLMNEHSLNYFYLCHKLMKIVNDNSTIFDINVVPINTPGNMTYKYYATKALRYVRQQYLKKEWRDFISLPPEEQILERGAVLIAQWCQPNVNVTFEDVSKRLDEIADLVKNMLYDSYPNHPLFVTPIDISTVWKYRNLDQNQWNVADCRKIMDYMGIVLYKHLGFHGNNEMYYVPENSYINEVLEKKRALPITLAIVYDAVARRLGVKCEPISFPAHFLLRWSYGPNEDDSFYIDVYNQGAFIKRGSCPHARPLMGSKNTPSVYPPSSARQVMIRMASNLELSGRQHVHPNGRITRLRSVLELLRMINPSDLTCMLNLARLYMLYNMDVSELRLSLQNQDFDMPRRAQADQIVQMLTDHESHHRDRNIYPKVEVAPRTHQLKYAVGMVMRHMGLNYICVIYDWDPRCLASSDWQEQMNVHLLSLKDQQPFYNVLVDDGSHRYVAQENIIPTKDAGSLHQIEDLGRHFSHFFETHFVPNAEKDREYPEDSMIRKLHHQKLFLDFKLF